MKTAPISQSDTVVRSKAPKIWLSSPHMSGHEQRFVNEAFDTNWIAPLGPHVDNFEKELSTYTGSKYTAALSSGTAAIHLGLIELGVRPGDEVICPSFTFSASANPIVYLGANPVFVDSEESSWNMCPVQLREALVDRLARGKKVKVIIAVHLYGMPANMKAIMAVANEFGIPVLEDAAEALGATYQGQACGTFGKMGILSFNGNKIITTSGGGALISDDENFVTRARFLATQARDIAPHYQHSEIGYNYRMSNVCAAIGRGQMMVLDERVQQRRANFDFYVENMSQLPGISFQPEAAPSFSNRWLTTVLIDSKESGGISAGHIYDALNAEDIEARPLWKPMHQQPVFRYAPYYSSREVCTRLFETGLCLPSGSNLSKSDLERVVETIKGLYKLV